MPERALTACGTARGPVHFHMPARLNGQRSTRRTGTAWYLRFFGMLGTGRASTRPMAGVCELPVRTSTHVLHATARCARGRRRVFQRELEDQREHQLNQNMYACSRVPVSSRDRKSVV